MAAKLELTFHPPGPILGDTIHVKNNFTFVTQRQNAFEVSIEPNNIPTVIGPRFRDAFNADINYLGEATVIGRIEYTDENMENALYILTITHPDDDWFDFIDNRTNFITHELTIVQGGDPDNPHPDPVALSAEISEASFPCQYYGLNVTASRAGYIKIEFPSGHEVDSAAIDDNYSIDLTRPVEAGTGVIKFFESENDTEVVNSIKFSPPPILHINTVYVVGSPFGASVTVDTEGGLVKQYSFDDESWQGSPQFFGLTPGDYTAYVRDNFGCVKAIEFEVLEEHVQGLTAPPFIRVPIHNSLRFADRSKNNFLGKLSAEQTTRCFHHEYLTGDRVRTQFKSSYKVNKAHLLKEDGTTEIPVIQKSSNINRISIYKGNYTEIDGRLAVYFTAGEIYNPDGTPSSEHLLSGKLPLWYGRGIYLDIEGVGPTQIERLYHDQDSETTYAITQMDGRGSAMGRKIKSIHTAHPYEVFEFEIEFVTIGTYQVAIEYGNDEGLFLSELVRISSELPDTYKSVRWLNTRNNDILYNTGIRQFRRVDIEKDFVLVPRAEKETYSTDTSVELVNSKTFAVYSLMFRAMPMEVARGIQTGLDNSDTIIIDGAVFVCEEPVSVEEDGLWFTVEAQLTLTDQTITGQQTIVDVVDAQFLLVGEDGPAFLRI